MQLLERVQQSWQADSDHHLTRLCVHITKDVHNALDHDRFCDLLVIHPLAYGWLSELKVF